MFRRHGESRLFWLLLLLLLSLLLLLLLLLLPLLLLLLLLLLPCYLANTSAMRWRVCTCGRYEGVHLCFGIIFLPRHFCGLLVFPILL